MAELTRLKVQWDNLFPSDTITIAGQEVPVKPMSFRKISTVVRELKGFGEVLSELDITWDNIGQPANMFTVVSILVDKFPSTLSKACNIHEDDIQEMPPELVVHILTKTLEINLKNKDAFLKNFGGLTGLLKNLLGVVDKDAAPEETPAT